MTIQVRPRLRPAVVRIVEALPVGALLRARRRFDHALTAGHATRRAPAALRIARLRPIPPEVRSFSPPGRPDLRFVNAESLAIQRIYWLGLNESGRHGAGTRLWEALCSRCESAVEIGANVGFYTVPGAIAGEGRYRAFEPHPGSAQVLRANLAENRIGHVEVIEGAVVPDGWESRPVKLTVPAGGDWATPAAATIGAPDGAGYEVGAIPIRTAIEGCDLLKVDVEGFEHALLRASLPDLMRIRPLLMIEVFDGRSELRALLAELVSTLEARVFAMRRSTLMPVAADRLRSGPLQSPYGTWDYLIVPPCRSATVQNLIGNGGTRRS